MRILALEPYLGGSHKAFLDGWSAHGTCEWTVLGLPPYKWKWRMRHAAITLAEQARRLVDSGQTWDAVFCSDMLNLAEFRGLAPPQVATLPTVAYFHENQLTYPVRHESERDYHFVFTNLTTALAADAVWFNTAFHRDSFLGALPGFLRRMPDHQPFEAVEKIREKSTVVPQGIECFPDRGARPPGPPRVLWAARWEHDKNPEALFEALGGLLDDGADFRLCVIGERFRDEPEIFERARTRFQSRIDHWGYLPTRRQYRECLLAADVIVSTAQHEFFGISVVEAMAAGAYPLLPRRLAYPEILSDIRDADARYFYDGSTPHLRVRLRDLLRRTVAGELWGHDPHICQRVAARFEWPHLAPQMDDAMSEIARLAYTSTP